MNYEKVLKKVAENKMDPQTAFDKLYTEDVIIPRAHFVKIKIRILDNPAASFFANMFFALPCPIFIINGLLKFAQKDMGEANYQLAKEVIGYAKGTVVTVNSKEAKIYIKVI